MASDPARETERTAFITVKLPVYGTAAQVQKTFQEFTNKVNLQFPKAKTTLEKMTMSPDT